jgi:TP901 family phage tail tape measure protein
LPEVIGDIVARLILDTSQMVAGVAKAKGELNALASGLGGSGVSVNRMFMDADGNIRRMSGSITNAQGQVVQFNKSFKEGVKSTEEAFAQLNKTSGLGFATSSNQAKLAKKQTDDLWRSVEQGATLNKQTAAWGIGLDKERKKSTDDLWRSVEQEAKLRQQTTAWGIKLDKDAAASEASIATKRAVYSKANRQQQAEDEAYLTKRINQQRKLTEGGGGGRTGGGLDSAAAQYARYIAVSTAILGTGAAIKSVITNAMDFQDSMANVATTMRGDTTESINGLKQGIIEMAGTLPRTPQDLGVAAYEIYSAGITDTSKALEILRAGSKLSIAGLGEETATVKMVTAAMNAFGKEAGDADKIANTMFAGVTLGVYKMEDLGSQFGKTAAMARMANVDLDHMTAYTAGITRAGIPASQAQVVLGQVFNQTTGASKKFNEALKSTHMTYQQFAGIVKEKGYITALETVRNKLFNVSSSMDLTNPKMVEANRQMSLLFGSRQGKIAVLEMLANPEVRAAIEETMTAIRSAGTLNEAAGKKTQTLAGQVEILKSAWQGLAISLGDAGVVSAATTMVHGLAKSAQEASYWIKELQKATGGPITSGAVSDTTKTQLENLQGSMGARVKTGPGVFDPYNEAQANYRRLQDAQDRAQMLSIISKQKSHADQLALLQRYFPAETKLVTEHGATIKDIVTNGQLELIDAEHKYHDSIKNDKVALAQESAVHAGEELKINREAWAQQKVDAASKLKELQSMYEGFYGKKSDKQFIKEVDPDGKIKAGIQEQIALLQKYQTVWKDVQIHKGVEGPLMGQGAASPAAGITNTLNSMVGDVNSTMGKLNAAMLGPFIAAAGVVERAAQQFSYNMVGGSIIPEMVDAIGAQFQRLNDLMVTPLERSSAAITTIFSSWQAMVSSGEGMGMDAAAANMVNGWTAVAAASENGMSTMIAGVQSKMAEYSMTITAEMQTTSGATTGIVTGMMNSIVSTISSGMDRAVAKFRSSWAEMVDIAQAGANKIELHSIVPDMVRGVIKDFEQMHHKMIYYTKESVNEIIRDFERLNANINFDVPGLLAVPELGPNPSDSKKKSDPAQDAYENQRKVVEATKKYNEELVKLETEKRTGIERELFKMTLDYQKEREEKFKNSELLIAAGKLDRTQRDADFATMDAQEQARRDAKQAEEATRRMETLEQNSSYWHQMANDNIKWQDKMQEMTSQFATQEAQLIFDGLADMIMGTRKGKADLWSQTQSLVGGLASTFGQYFFAKGLAISLDPTTPGMGGGLMAAGAALMAFGSLMSSAGKRGADKASGSSGAGTNYNTTPDVAAQKQGAFGGKATYVVDLGRLADKKAIVQDLKEFTREVVMSFNDMQGMGIDIQVK